MGLKAYIPGTQERAQRLFIKGLRGQLGDHDGLAEIEWEDGSISYRPVYWSQDLGGIVDDEDNFWLARGEGSKPKSYYGVDIWRVYAGNAGIISTEAALIAHEERYDTVIDVGAGDEIPDDLESVVETPDEPDEIDPNGNGHAEELAADGGADGAIYDLRPPDGADGVTFSIRDADDFDPFPVDRKAANGAAEHYARAEGYGEDTWMYGFLVGLGVVAGFWLLWTIIPWLLNQIGGSGGGSSGGGGETVKGLLTLMAGPVSLREYVSWRLNGGETDA